MGVVLENESGKIYISKHVISSIAGYAATECYGIVGMSAQKNKNSLFELFSKDSNKKGINVELVDDQLIIDVYIVVGYGTKISEIANNVRDRIYYTIQKCTGLKIDKVNIIVQGVKVID